MTQFLYIELQNRHSFETLHNQNSSHENREEIWMTYLEIFESIQNEDVILPFEWIADLLDSFTQ